MAWSLVECNKNVQIHGQYSQYLDLLLITQMPVYYSLYEGWTWTPKTEVHIDSWFLSSMNHELPQTFHFYGGLRYGGPLAKALLLRYDSQVS